MFYCDTCANSKKWPISLSKSGGCCEICGQMTICNDTPSSRLPLPEKPLAVQIIEIDAQIANLITKRKKLLDQR